MDTLKLLFHSLINSKLQYEISNCLSKKHLKFFIIFLKNHRNSLLLYKTNI